jgi:c-di-GMP-binding flagellar brake protein YcgR
MALSDYIEAKKILKIGTRLDIIVYEDGGGYATYSSRIEDIEKNLLVLAMPMDQGYPIIPPVGEFITGRIADTSSAYLLNTIYLGKRAEPIPVWLVRMPELVKKCQQREFVRVNVLLSGMMQCEDENEELGQQEFIKIRNLSGGGAQLGLPHDVAVGSKMFVTFEVPGVGRLRLYSEVVRTDGIVNDYHIAAVKFLNISERLRVQLIRYVFDCERRVLRQKR